MAKFTINHCKQEQKHIKMQLPYILHFTKIELHFNENVVMASFFLFVFIQSPTEAMTYWCLWCLSDYLWTKYSATRTCV